MGLYRDGSKIFYPQIVRGELLKKKFGPGMLTGFWLLAILKGLRGGALDIFGKTEERKMERALIVDYKASMDDALQRLTTDNHATAIEIARIPDLIKGFGHVKERNLKAARVKWDELTVELHDPKAQQRAA